MEWCPPRKETPHRIQTPATSNVASETAETVDAAKGRGGREHCRVSSLPQGVVSHARSKQTQSRISASVLLESVSFLGLQKQARPGGLKQQKSTPPKSGGRKSEIKVPARPGSLRLVGGFLASSSFWRGPQSLAYRCITPVSAPDVTRHALSYLFLCVSLLLFL